MSSTPSDARYRFLPWRSAAAGWIATFVISILGVPLFLCMPPWADVTLYDMAARAILRGGVHYRDIFDTNLPGMPLSMACIRSILGPGYEALRAVDLAVIALEVLLLSAWSRRAGGTAWSAAWFAAAAALFYPFTSEFNHIQRDPWMLLPALVAARLRLNRIERAISFPSRNGTLGQSVLEGLAWGAAVWLKPHVVVPAFSLWSCSVIVLARYENRRSLSVDLAGLLVGGLMAGGAGVAWLLWTGAWPYFVDVFTNWNPSYLADMWGDAPARFLRTFYCFLPWSTLNYAAVPLAFLALWEARVWSRRAGQPQAVRAPHWIYLPAATESVAAARALMAALYLGWFAQAVCLQKGFDYVQVPLVFLAMALVASQRWAFGFALLVWFAFLAALSNLPFLAPLLRTLGPTLNELRADQDPLTDFELVKLWPRCWMEGGSPELRDKLGHFTDIFCGTNWEDLEGVARFLKSLDPPLGPGELNCWHDSTHPLYLMLDLEPATRYMHYGTVFRIPGQEGRIAADVAASRQRYVVSDLMRITWHKSEAYEPGAGGDPHRLPRWLPLSQRKAFPWNQPIVFRSGRYLVHKVIEPLGPIDVPDWFKLDELGPGEPH